MAERDNYPTILLRLMEHEELVGMQDSIWWGQENLAQKDAPPRIVVWPTTDDYLPSSGQAGDGMGNLPHVLVTARMNIEVHFWALRWDGPEGMHELRSRWIRANHDLLHGSYGIPGSGGQWLPGNLSAHGFAYLLRMWWDIPVTRAAVDSVSGVNPIPSGSFTTI